MANVKISDLPSATTVAPTDTTVIVQGGVTKRATWRLYQFLSNALGAVTRSLIDKLSDVVSVKDFGAIGNGIADDTAAIQAAINTARNIFIPWTAAGYKISASIVQKGDIIGEGVLGAQSRLVPATADFAAIVNDPTQNLNRFYTANLDIDFSVATGGSTTIATNSSCSGIKYSTNGGLYPYEFIMENVLVRNAYTGFNDVSASYMSAMRQLRATYCRIGFLKVLGTTMHYENCFSDHCKKGWSITGTYNPVLTACANDNTVQDGTYPYAVEFISCAGGPVINGFDHEANTISGAFSAFMKFDACDGFSLSGMKGLSNTYVTGASECYGIQLVNSSRGVLRGIVLGASNTDVSSGAGSSQMLVVAAGSVCTVEGSNITPATGAAGTQYSYVNAGTLFSKATTKGTTFNSGKYIDEDSMGVAPNTQTGATYTVAATDQTIIANRAGTITLTLPTPSATASDRKLRIVTIQAQTVVSASANVVPLAGGAAVTGILAATAGKWADIELDSTLTNWIITASN